MLKEKSGVRRIPKEGCTRYDFNTRKNRGKRAGYKNGERPSRIVVQKDSCLKKGDEPSEKKTNSETETAQGHSFNATAHD